MSKLQADLAASVWCLEGLDDHHRLVRVPLHTFPFRIGRLPGLELTLISDRVSKLQAEIDLRGDVLLIRDLGSTNGTYVNRRRVRKELELHDSDILHFGDVEFQIGCFSGEKMRLMVEKTANIEVDLPTSMLTRRRRLRELLDREALQVLYQSICSLDGEEIYAREALCRGALEGLPESPAALLELASGLGQSVALSRLMNVVCVERYSSRGKLFLNVHPDELRQSGLVTHLERLHRRDPELDLVLEIPENAVTDPAALRELGDRLTEIGVEMAYDDFGAGRSRLLELLEAPPRYLKFDRCLIQGLGLDKSRQRLVRALLEITADLDVVSIAEGIETAADAAACQDLGFDYGQGYFFSRPAAGDS